MPPAELNCDFGEGYGLARYGDDAGLAPFVHVANVACGFHGGDPATMARTVALAADHGVKIGAHPSFPDLAGFGRRNMTMSRSELTANVLYQIGALKGFLDARGLPLNYVKLHGLIYSASGADADLAEGLLDAVEVFDVPLYGIAGSETDKAAQRRGLPFLPEFFVDLVYRDDGSFVTDKTRPIDTVWAARRAVRAVAEGVVDTERGGTLPIRFDTICIHNDMPNAVDVARAVRQALDAVA